MTYTLWHSGVLMGEAEFTRNPVHSRNMAGVFQPTAYGRQLMPTLTALLTAGADLRDALRRRGLSEDDDVDSPEMADVLESSDGGRRMSQIVRTVNEIEVRDPSGSAMDCTWIGFMDMGELTTLSRRLGTGLVIDFDALTPGAPEFIVSVTVRSAESLACLPSQ